MRSKSKKAGLKANGMGMEDGLQANEPKEVEAASSGSAPGAPAPLDDQCRRWTLVFLSVLTLLVAVASFWPHWHVVGTRLHVEEMVQLFPTSARGVVEAGEKSAPAPFLRTTSVSLPPGRIRMGLDGLAAGAENAVHVQTMDAEGGFQENLVLEIPQGSGTDTREKRISFHLPPDPASSGNRTVRFEVSYGGQGRLQVKDLVVEDEDEDGPETARTPLLIIVGALVLVLSGAFARAGQVGYSLLLESTDAREGGAVSFLLAFPTVSALLFFILGSAVVTGIGNDSMLQLMAESELDSDVMLFRMALFAAVAVFCGVGGRGVLRCCAVPLAFVVSFTVLGIVAASREELVLDCCFAKRVPVSLAILLALMEVLSPCLLKGRERLQAWLFTGVESIALAMPAVALVYWAVFGQMFSTPAIEAIWQTNPHEALRFASAYVPHLIALVAAVAAGLYGLYRSNLVRVRRIRDRHEPLFTPAAIGFLVLDMAIVLASLGMDAWKSPVAQELRATADYFQRISPRPTFDLSSVKRADAPAPRTRIIAIGESAGRDRHSLYGYGKATTPWMDAMAREGGLVAFANAYAGNKYTYHALEMALTEADQYDGRRFEESRSLVEVMRAAGATVTWLSNQERDFNRGMPFGIMASSCNAAFWTDRPGESYDMDLVQLLKDRVDPSKDNLVIVHMNGSHLVYGDRTPEDERVFGKEARDVSNDYDDSVLYTDRTLKALFEYAQGNLNLESFIYLSDHGEVPGVPRDTFRWGMARIPFALWLSDEYRAAHPDVVRRLESRRDAWWTNDLLFDLALGLYGVRMDGMEPDKDLSSEAWSMDPMKMTTENGRHYLVNDPNNPAR